MSEPTPKPHEPQSPASPGPAAPAENPRRPGLSDLRFWLLGLCVAGVLVAVMAPGLGRPFYGLHSWGKAHSAWFGRVHAKFGFGYTKGLCTWAVGNPPPENPRRYLDHPQGETFCTGVESMILGWQEWSFRTWMIIKTLATLAVLLALVRGLADGRTALLAGLLFALMPITGFFGVTNWQLPLSWLGVWAYLAATGQLHNTAARRWHLGLMGAAFVLSLLMSWEGAFFIMAVWVHALALSIVRKTRGQRGYWPALAVATVSPLIGLGINFSIMVAGFGGFDKIWDLYRWRATQDAHRPDSALTWSAWFGQFWLFARANFSTVGWWTGLASMLFVFGSGAVEGLRRLAGRSEKQSKKGAKPKAKTHPPPAGPGARAWGAYLPGLGLLALPAVFQLLLLRSALMPHEYWMRPLAPLLAVSTAWVLWLLYDRLAASTASPAAGRAIAALMLAGVTVVLGVYGYMGLQRIRYPRWQHPRKLAMLTGLRNQIPPQKRLLSFDRFRVNEHPVKGEHYRPEIAYYLDRPIDSAFPKSMWREMGWRYEPVPVVAIDRFDPQTGQLVRPPRWVPEVLRYIQQQAASGKYARLLVPEAVAAYAVDPRSGQAVRVALPAEPLFVRPLSQRFPVVGKVEGARPQREESGDYLVQRYSYRAGMPAYYILDLTAGAAPATRTRPTGGSAR